MDYSKVIDEIFSQFQGQKFSVRFWNGKESTYGTGVLPAFTIIIKNEWTAKRLLAQGSLGFGESYMEGKLDIQGDLDAYLRLRHQFKRVRKSMRLAFASFLARRSIPKNRGDQISYHYDLGNDFFRMVLDHDTMSYSAGLYETGSESLAEAQRKKLVLLSSWLDLAPGSSVLDLGSGWGGFAKHMAQDKKSYVSSYTLSKAQLEYCRDLARGSDLEKFVTFEYGDMLDGLPDKQFDGVMMIESIEHVGQKNLLGFFHSLSGVIKPGGPLILQLTGRYSPRPVDKWTLKYVFPGGYLPAKDELLAAAQSAGFVIETFRDDTPDYIRTMSEWIKNLENNRESIERKFGTPFYRLWVLWMHGARVSFETSSMNLFRIRLKRSS